MIKERMTENKKNKIFKKIKKRKEKKMSFEIREIIYILIIFLSLLMIPFLSNKIEINQGEKDQNMEAIYKKLEVTE